MENTWVPSSPYAQVPPFAVLGGHDSDGTPIYVGRSFHEGDNLPAKVIPSKGTAYVAWGGQEITKQHYEILVGQGYGWVPCYGGSVPPNAVRSGNTRTGEPLYVGRGHHANSLTVGKIHPSHGCLYIPFGGQEVRISTYEVLVHENRDQWVGAAIGYTPPNAVVAGHDTDRAVIYVGRAMQEGYKWVHCSVFASIPEGAVKGGNDADGAMMYVGRAFHNGDTLVAKIIPSRHFACVSWRGEEILKKHFEVLCGQDLAWHHCYDHIVPENAISCGTTALGQPVYVGRGHFEGSLTVGKVSSVHRALFIAFGGMERRLESYEILVEEKRPAGWDLPSTPPPPPPPPPTSFDVKPYPLPEMIPEKVCPYPMDMKPYPEPMDVKPPPYTPMPQPSMNVASICYTPPKVFDPPPPYPSIPPSAPMPMPMPTPMPTPATVYTAPTPATVYTAPTPATVYTAPTPATVYTASAPPPASSSFDIWMSATPSYMPPGAVHAGHDTDLSTLVVIRAFHEGHLIPGKAVPNHACAYISYGGHAIPKSHFEVLIGEGYHWVPAQDGHIVPGAVEAGRTSNGEPLFVGRAHYGGSLTPGKIQRSHQCMYIAFNGTERRVSNYEVLVRMSDYYHGNTMKMAY